MDSPFYSIDEAICVDYPYSFQKSLLLLGWLPFVML